jgi:hypothetical protein
MHKYSCSKIMVSRVKATVHFSRNKQATTEEEVSRRLEKCLCKSLLILLLKLVSLQMEVCRDFWNITTLE